MKKSLQHFLICISILMGFNACNPSLPTGGNVTPTNIYKVHNKKFYYSNCDFCFDTVYYNQFNTEIDINNDGVNDILISPIQGHYGLVIQDISNIIFATNITNNKIKSYNLLESINSSSVFSSDRFTAVVWSPLGFTLPESDIDNFNSLLPSAYYVGFAFEDGTTINYGWIKIFIGTESGNNGNGGTGYNIISVIESCYNTIPNQPILAGKK